MATKWNLNGNPIRASGSETLLSDALRRRIQNQQPQPVQQMRNIPQAQATFRTGSIQNYTQNPNQTAQRLAPQPSSQINSRISVSDGQQRRGPRTSTGGTADPYTTSRHQQMQPDNTWKPGMDIYDARGQIVQTDEGKKLDDQAQMWDRYQQQGGDTSQWKTSEQLAAERGLAPQAPTPEQQLQQRRDSILRNMQRGARLANSASEAWNPRNNPNAGRSIQGLSAGSQGPEQRLRQAAAAAQKARASSLPMTPEQMDQIARNSQQAGQRTANAVGGGQQSEYGTSQQGLQVGSSQQALTKDQEAASKKTHPGIIGGGTIEDVARATGLPTTFIINHLKQGGTFGREGGNGKWVVGAPGEEMYADGAYHSSTTGSPEDYGKGSRGEYTDNYMFDNAHEINAYANDEAEQDAADADVRRWENYQAVSKGIDENTAGVMDDYTAAFDERTKALDAQFAKQQGIALRAAAERAARGGLSPEQMQAGLSGTTTDFAGNQYNTQTMAALEHEKQKVSVNLDAANKKYQAAMAYFQMTDNAEQQAIARDAALQAQKEMTMLQQKLDEYNSPSFLEQFGVGALGALGTVAAGVGGLFTGGSTWAAIPGIIGGVAGTVNAVDSMGNPTRGQPVMTNRGQAVVPARGSINLNQPMPKFKAGE